jgi:hypothetical protein
MLATDRAARTLDCWNHADATFAFHEFLPKCLRTSNVESRADSESIRPELNPKAISITIKRRARE